MRILLPFFDDSTLIFSAKIKGMLAAHGFDVITLMETISETNVSPRQLEETLPEGPDLTGGSSLYLGANGSNFDAVVVSKAGIELRKLLKQNAYRKSRDRPAYIAFQPGLEFTPDKGRKNRADFDIVFLNNTSHRDAFERVIKRTHWRHVSYGHPYFKMPEVYNAKAENKNIYFFAQAICPFTLSSRRFMLEVLETIARRYPDRTVFVKLRHLPGENANHVHKEMFSYPWLMERYIPNPPVNFKFTTCTMSEALSDAALCITCTSTAAMDAVSAGVPTQVFVDYPQYYLDPYAEPMRREFAESDLLTTVPLMMELAARKPRESWMQNHFRGDDLFDELRAAVTAFKTRSRVISR